MVKDIAWIAGLLEGEGSFAMTSKTAGYKISLGMTDPDVIGKAAEILGTNKISIEERPKYNNKFYKIGIYGNLAIQWMMTIYPLMGMRRQSKIAEILNIWKNHERTNFVNGLCKRGHEISEKTLEIIHLKSGKILKRCKLCKQLREAGYRESF